ncbi:MAG TPA: hypothetical protein VFK02_14030 [Kofleriaceae bacterium]|nr:hypothetical protein [Kofleriaceae bacterium]
MWIRVGCASLAGIRGVVRGVGLSAVVGWSIRPEGVRVVAGGGELRVRVRCGRVGLEAVQAVADHVGLEGLRVAVGGGELRVRVRCGCVGLAGGGAAGQAGRGAAGQARGGAAGQAARGAAGQARGGAAGQAGRGAAGQARGGAAGQVAGGGPVGQAGGSEGRRPTGRRLGRGRVVSRGEPVDPSPQIELQRGGRVGVLVGRVLACVAPVRPRLQQRVIAMQLLAIEIEHLHHRQLLSATDTDPAAHSLPALHREISIFLEAVPR